MSVIKRFSISLLLLLFSSAALAQAPWITVPLTGFDNLANVQIFANFPAPDPAMDNLVLNDGVVVTMDFEGVAPPGGGAVPVAPYTEDGYTLNASAGSHGIFDSASPGDNTNGSDIFGWCGSCGGSILFTVTNNAANPFSIQSIDVSTLNGPGGGANSNAFGIIQGGQGVPPDAPLIITVRGNVIGGGVVQQIIVINPLADREIPSLSTWSIWAMILVLLLAVVGLNRRYSFF